MRTLILCLLSSHFISYTSAECFNFADDNDDGICYEIFLSENWSDALARCHGFRAEVASVHSQQENSYIRRLAVSQGVLGGVLLGGAMTGKGNAFEWVDGTAWDYANYRSGYPMPGKGECLVLDTSTSAGEWINADCDKPMPVVCARSPVFRATPTPAPTPDEALPIQETDPRYGAYKDFADLLGSWMNTTIDPCDDFYAFTCGAGKPGQQAPQYLAQDAADDLMVEQLRLPVEHFERFPLPVQQLKWFYDACQNPLLPAEKDQHSKRIITDLRQANPDFGFPLFYPAETSRATPEQLAAFLGYSAGTLGIGTIVAPRVDTNWVDPQLVNGQTEAYALFLYQPSTLFAYAPEIYTKPGYMTYATDFILEMIKDGASLLGITDLDPKQARQDAQDMAAFDKDLTTKYTNQSLSTAPYSFSDMYHPMSVSSLQKDAPFLDWKTFLDKTLSPISKTVDGDFQLIVANPDGVRLLSADIASGAVSSRTLNNYLYIRVLGFLWGATTQAGDQTPLDAFHRPKTIKNGRSKSSRSSTRNYKEYYCAATSSNLLPAAYSRVYVDARYPMEGDRNAVRDQMQSFLGSLAEAFGKQIEQLDWMSVESKQNAQKKISNIVFNIAYPDWITDDAKLTDHYKMLDISRQDSALDQVDKLRAFALYTGLSPLLAEGPAIRNDFAGQCAIADLYEQAELNSLTLPGGLVHTPVYDVDYPAAANYGSLGYLAGQVMSKGFDQIGRQWDFDGSLKSWMDAGSAAAFDASVPCIDEQFGSFCPLGPGRPCINAAKTERDNVADTAGLQIALDAFKKFQASNGVDPRLPGAASMFNAEQLFFLGYAQTRCEYPPSDSFLLEEILQFDEAPSEYQVLGTLQNTPSFREAFNCPVGSVYAPAQHCHVWTPFTN